MTKCHRGKVDTTIRFGDTGITTLLPLCCESVNLVDAGRVTGTQQARALTTPDKSSDVMVKPCSALAVVVNELDGEVKAHHGDECNPG